MTLHSAEKHTTDSSQGLNVVIGESKYEFLEYGFYLAELVSVEEGIGAFHQPIFKFHFKLLEEPHVGKAIQAWVNRSASGHGGKLWRLIRALSGDELEVLDNYSLERLYGRKCGIYVERDKKLNRITDYVTEKEYKANRGSGA